MRLRQSILQQLKLLEYIRSTQFLLSITADQLRIITETQNFKQICRKNTSCTFGTENYFTMLMTYVSKVQHSWIFCVCTSKLYNYAIYCNSSTVNPNLSQWQVYTCSDGSKKDKFKLSTWQELTCQSDKNKVVKNLSWTSSNLSPDKYYDNKLVKSKVVNLSNPVLDKSMTSL